MKKLPDVYLIDSLAKIDDLSSLGTDFAKAVEFLKSRDLQSLALGRHEIDGDRVYVNVADAELVAPRDRRGELHHAYFDIQIPLGTPETIGLARFEPGESAANAAPCNGSSPDSESFDEAKDVGFYDRPLDYVTLQVGEFGLFYPKTCLHAPACTLDAPHVSRKLVVKVKA